MKPGEFWDAGFGETLLVIKGYESRVNVLKHETRLLIYTITCTVTSKDDRGSVFDLYWLPGDPTPDDLQQELKESQEEAAQRQQEHNEHVRELVKQGKW